MKNKIFKIILFLTFLSLVVYGYFAIIEILKNRTEGLNNHLAKISKINDQTKSPGPLFGPEQASRAQELLDSEIIKWTNYYRDQEGINLLSENQKLTLAAQSKANDMFARQYFEHQSPTGENAADLAQDQGYSYKIIGENLALGDFLNEKELVDAWMASAGHRANILHSEFTEIGVASKLDKFNDRITWISVQIFGRPAPECKLPNANLRKSIDDKNNIGARINQLSSEGNHLLSQGNSKIEEGNRIYAHIGDASQAQTYWDQGKDLQSQGRAKIDQAKSFQSSISDLSSLIDEYNFQVEQYNQCISN